MKDNYVAIKFQRLIYEDYAVLIPTGIIDGELTSLFTTKFNEEYDTIFDYECGEEDCFGFVKEKKQLFYKYFDKNEKITESKMTKAIIKYRDEIFDKFYFQKYNRDEDETITYEILTKKNKFHINKIATCQYGVNTMLDNPEMIEYNEKMTSQEEIDCLNGVNKTVQKSNNKKIEKIDVNKYYKEMKKRVIGQDDIIRFVLAILKKNEQVDNYRNKTNILLIGASGNGKTEIFRSLSEISNKPLVIADMTQVTPAGYVGRDVESYLLELYQKTNENLEIAENGILVLDEIDKLVSSDKKELNGDKVIVSLLKLVEGADFEINTSSNPLVNKKINFNTSRLTIAATGSFGGIVNIDSKSIGFNKDVNNIVNYNDVSIEELIKFGLPREFLRRFVFKKINKLSLIDYIKIMKEAKYSPLINWENLIKKYDCNFKFSDEFIEYISKEAIKKELGVSFVKNFLDEMFLPIMFDFESKSKSKLELTSNDNKYIYQLVKKK